MTCFHCGRALLKAAKTLKGKGGDVHYGRRCAIKARLLTPKPRVAKVAANEVDERQMALELTE